MNRFQGCFWDIGANFTLEITLGEGGSLMLNLVGCMG